MRILVAASMLAAGCTCEDNRETLFVRQVQVPSEECIVSPDPGSLFRSSGVLDVAFGGSYTLSPLMENQMVARASRADVRTESNGIQIEGAIVRVYESSSDASEPPEETEPVLEFFTYASSYVEPESTGVTDLEVIPPQYTQSRFDDLCSVEDDELVVREDLVLVGVTMQGTSNGGLEVESPEFLYPIRLCCGCTVVCPPEADSEDVVGVDCCGTDEVDDVPCNPGQDDGVDCRLIRGLTDPVMQLFFLCGGSTSAQFCPADT